MSGQDQSILFYREIKNNQDQIDMQRDLDALIRVRARYYKVL